MTALKKFGAAIILALIIFTPVEAKILPDKVPLLTFSDAAVSVYDAPDGTKKGSIPAENSLVLVKEIRSDGWAYGSYKPQNVKKRVYCWFKMTELQGYENFENYTDQLTSDTDVCRTRTNSYSYNGNAPSNEDVIVIGQRGDKTKIIFKSDDNYYRMGWVSNSALKKNSATSGTESTFTTSDENYYSTETETENEWGDDDK